MPNADPLNLKTEDDLSVPGAGGKTSNTRLKGKNQLRRKLTDTRRRQESIGSEWG
jgi:hypothetical protein